MQLGENNQPVDNFFQVFGSLNSCPGNRLRKFLISKRNQLKPLNQSKESEREKNLGLILKR